MWYARTQEEIEAVQSNFDLEGYDKIVDIVADSQEFIDRENKVMDKFIHNYHEKPKKERISFGKDDIDILVKFAQNDMRKFLEKTWEGFRGELSFSFKDGKPEYLKAIFEATDNSKNWDEHYNKFRDFIGEFGFVTHKKYWTEKRLYGEKYYRYDNKKRK